MISKTFIEKERIDTAVFPEPVCAHAMRSLFESAMGIAARWTGIGWTNFAARMLFSRTEPRSISLHVRDK